MALPYSATTDPLRQRCSRFGGPGQIRTGDLRLRRPSLYPPELRAHRNDGYLTTGGWVLQSRLCAERQSASQCSSASCPQA